MADDETFSRSSISCVSAATLFTIRTRGKREREEGEAGSYWIEGTKTMMELLRNFLKR